MAGTFENLLREVCNESLQNEYEQLERTEMRAEEVPLPEASIAILAEKILALPTDYITLILCKYCYNDTPEEVTQTFGIEMAKGKLRYVHKMLSNLMGLDRKLIDEQSMRQAGKIALQQYVAYDSAELIQPHYSNSFRKKLKDIKAVQKTASMAKRILKRVAVIILVCAISFSSAMVASADLRKAVFEWFVETFPEFSSFWLDHSDGVIENEAMPADLKIGYIPEGFELYLYDESGESVYFEYRNSSQKMISVIFAKDTGLSGNTEDSVVHEITFKDNKAYWWERNTGRSTTYWLVWNQNGVLCRVCSDVALEEVFKIAENVER